MQAQQLDLKAVALMLQDLAKRIKTRASSEEDFLSAEKSLDEVRAALKKPPTSRGERPIYDKLVKEVKALSVELKAQKESFQVDNESPKLSSDASFITAQDQNTMQTVSLIELGPFDELAFDERHKELEELKDSMLDVQRIGIQIAELTTEQNEPIAKIDDAVGTSEMELNTAHRELNLAAGFLDSYRRKLVVVVCIVVVLVVGGTVLGVLLAVG
jgi:hypothetical protein